MKKFLKFKNKIGIRFGVCGLLSLFWAGGKNEYYFHFLTKRLHRVYGFEKDDWYDKTLYSFGLGPILLICWYNKRFE